jgi:hypothetical protein
VPNRRIAVTLEELIAILAEIQSRWGRQDWDDLIAPEPLDEPGEKIVRDGIKYRLVAREITQIGQRRMGTTYYFAAEFAEVGG